jgi:hypothetical protein
MEEENINGNGIPDVFTRFSGARCREYAGAANTMGYRGADGDPRPGLAGRRARRQPSFRSMARPPTILKNG